MRIAYATTFDARDIHAWSGTPYHMSSALSASGISIDYVGNLKRQLPPFFKVKQTMKKWLCQQRESPRFNVFVAKHYSAEASQKINELSCDAVLAPLIHPIAYLDCKAPIILWTDALYAGLLGFYPPFLDHSPSSMKQGNIITAECLSRCSLAIFSSEWAANTAIEIYGASKDKVKVVPFGANIDRYPSYSDIQTIIKNRSQDTIKLLFLAKSWERKGGDIVLAVAKALHEAGHAVELTIVGYHPPGLQPIPPYIKCLGFVSKHTPEGKLKIQQLLSESHFLFVPSRAEAYGIVFCEANAFGLPCLSTHVGGISTIIKDHVNGMTFACDATIESYCNYLVNLMQDKKQYHALAQNAYNEFTTRLNWQTATQQVNEFIKTVI
ncbi:MAG: hypothetical protein A3F12_05345 [Gammaproteobacteria bacterium RIFCSPHIGHO2_12_FULL_38_14]|nr:MAG: hypothetical protein A3F12_05345 [Gammaproteobacteria bacterium RIFCSPHIGHO2_12_FULL_38_14]